jgi:ATP-dependent Clp protease ATP-binding subunit ClpA
MLREVKEIAKGIGISINYTNEAIEKIAEKSYVASHGARPIRRTIMTLIENPLSKKILSNEINEGDTVLVKCENDEIVLVKA